jgi:hypothetical protein
MLLGKLHHRREGGDGQGAEAIAVKRSSSMFETSTRRVIDGNMEVSHRQVVSPVATMKVSRRRVAAPARNMRLRACRGGALIVKA